MRYGSIHYCISFIEHEANQLKHTPGYQTLRGCRPDKFECEWDIKTSQIRIKETSCWETFHLNAPLVLLSEVNTESECSLTAPLIMMDINTVY